MINCKPVANESGFTLLELLIYVSLSSIILTAGLVGLTEANRSYHATDALAKEVRDSRDCLEVISEELKYASSIKIAASKDRIASYFYTTESVSRSIYVGSDKLLYRKIGTNPAVALTGTPLQSFSCSFNESDTDKETIDLKVVFPNRTEVVTSVHALNPSDNNEYTP